MNRKKSLPLLLLLFTPAALPAEVVNRIVLRVNDQIATLNDYQDRRQEYVQEISRREQDPEERQRMTQQAGEVAYAEMYQELLLRSRAEQLGIDITEAQVDEAVGQLRQSYQIKTDQEFQAALAQSGMTVEQLREQLRGTLRLQEVRGREIASRVKLDEEDLRRYYRKNIEQFRQPEQLQLREVVVLEEGGLPTAEERARVAGEVRQAVAAGKSLADAVAEHSGKGVTSNAIELGWVSPGDLDASLEAAVWKLPKGAVSEPVQARGGLHLVQVIDRRESRVPPFNEVADAIRQREQNRLYQEEWVKYLGELEKKSLIVATPPPDATGFRARLEARQAAPEGELEGLAAGAEAAAAESNPSLPSVATPSPPGGEPGRLPEPKPVNPTPPAIPPPGH
jgi:parvulin-like peptidyl-prolyl isomerase